MKQKQLVNSKSMIMVFVIFICVIIFSTISAYAANPKLSKKSLSLRMGDKAKLKVLNNKKKIKNKVTWSSKNKRIAVVSSDGTVSALSAGTTYVVANVRGKKLKCKVNVKRRVIDLTPYMGKSIKPLLKQIDFIKDGTEYYFGGGVTKKNYKYTDHTPTLTIECKGTKIKSIDICTYLEKLSTAEAKIFCFYGLTLPVSVRSAEEILLSKGFSVVEKKKRYSPGGDGKYYHHYDETFQKNNVELFLSSSVSEPESFFSLESRIKS